MMMPDKKDSFLKTWFQAVQAFAFPASFVPISVGAALAAYYKGSVKWILLPLVVVCSLLFHAGTNVFNDYFDYKKGVDQDYSYSSSKILFQGKLKPKQLLTGGIIMFLVAAALGLILVAFRGWPMLILGVIGLLGGIFYTAGPLAYKYFAMGDIFVFILMGPLMVIGSYFALTGRYHNNILAVSLPIGCLVAAILSANNLRDIKHDAAAGIKTIAILLGHKKARLEYSALVLAAFVFVVALIVFKMLDAWSLIVFAALPVAFRNTKLALKADPNDSSAIADLDVKTAQLHLFFGLLLIASILLAKFL